jgi:hypothetical protein
MLSTNLAVQRRFGELTGDQQACLLCVLRVIRIRMIRFAETTVVTRGFYRMRLVAMYLGIPYLSGCQKQKRPVMKS